MVFPITHFTKCLHHNTIQQCKFNVFRLIHYFQNSIFFFENINSARLLEYLPSYNILVKHEKTKEKLESFILDKWASFPDHLILVVEKLVWCVS